MEPPEFDIDTSQFITLNAALMVTTGFLAGIVLTINPRAAGRFIGLVGLTGIAFLSFAIMNGRDEDWAELFKYLGITSDLIVVVTLSYLGMTLSAA